MGFGGTWWLAGLAAWGAVALYLLWGRRRLERVPFLELWLGPVRGPRPKHHVAAPPVALALALLSLLLAVLAAARPYMARRGNGTTTVTVVLDRGASMSARGDVQPRSVETAQRLADALAKSTPALDAYVVPPAGPSPRRSDVGTWMNDVRELPRTAVDTTASLRATVARALKETQSPVLVITDRPIEVGDPRLVQIAPPGTTAESGMVHVAVRQSPQGPAHAMVRLHNTTPQTSARLTVTHGDSASPATSQEIPLSPPGGGPRDTFIDLPPLGDVVEFRLASSDGLEADDVAWLVREGAWPRVEARAALPPALARMVDVYAKSRPAGETSPRVGVVASASDLPPSAPAAAVVSAEGQPVATGATQVVDHPITRNFSLTESQVRLSDVPDGDWTPVVRINGKPAVAVRERPARQVWVGFDSADWARRPAYVVFWANIFDWLGGSGEPVFRSYPVGPLGAGWRRIAGTSAGGAAGPDTEPGLWPGLYERAEDGARRAVNALDVQFPVAAPSTARQDWPRNLAAAMARSGGGRIDLSPWVVVAAVACVVLSALTWRGSRRRAVDTSFDRMSWPGHNLTASGAGRNVTG